MSIPIESKEQQFAVIEANGNYFGAVAYQGYCQFQEKGTLILLRQLHNEGTTLEDWQVKFKPITYIDSMVSDWKEAGLQDLVIKYNPEVSVICTFLYPNGAHSSYHFSPELPPPALLQQLPQDKSGSE